MNERFPAAVIFRSSVFSTINVLAIAAAAVLIAVTTGAPLLFAPGLRDRPVVIVGAILLLGLFVLLAFAFARMEVTFDGRAVTLGFSFIKKRIPLENIKTLEAGNATFWEAGGTGIHFLPGRISWSAGPGPIIKITTAKISYWASCQNPERLVALVDQYRGALRG